VSEKLPPDGTKERPWTWPYEQAKTDDWVKVTTGVALVEAIDREGIQVIPEGHSRMWLRRPRGR
jgi:hypothetical protein